jgi:hypothetical protein
MLCYAMLCYAMGKVYIDYFALSRASVLVSNCAIESTFQASPHVVALQCIASLLSLRGRAAVGRVLCDAPPSRGT